MYKRFADEVFDDLVEEMEESEQDPAEGGAAAVEAGVAVGGLAWEISKAIFEADGDVTWNRRCMRNAAYPFDDPSYENKGSWVTNRIPVYGRVHPLPFLEVSACFHVDYSFNGYAVGHVIVWPPAVEDAPGFSLHVDQDISVDPETYNGLAGPFRAICVRFTYMFESYTSTEHDYKEYRITGEGDVSERCVP